MLFYIGDHPITWLASLVLALKIVTIVWLLTKGKNLLGPQARKFVLVNVLLFVIGFSYIAYATPSFSIQLAAIIAALHFNGKNVIQAMKVNI